jgi:hypothetical protein
MSEQTLFHQLRRHVRAFCQDECGETSIASLVLICTIIAIGATVGLASLRDQITQEFGDLRVAIESLDQSFNAGTYGSYNDTLPYPTPVDGQPSDSIGFVP